MCGIAGWVDFHRDLSGEDAILQAMADTLACRGPDAQGFYRSKEAAFAHRRLAVIDLEGGKQPMVRRVPGAATNGAGDSVVLTYSGEVYNFVELRMDLAGLGHPFETRSDTEVVLRAYLQWGPACVERFNGMFAFGIWDGAKRQLFLARDRLGVKPLFYALTGEGIVFGSEPKALLAHPDVPSDVTDEGLADIFAFGPARTPGQGIFRTIRELRPAHLLVFSDKKAHVSRYWQLQSRPHTDDVDTTAAKVRDLLEDTVRRQLISDVPVCTLLSGGLDSSAITALAGRTLAEEGRGPVQTYTIDFEGSQEDFTPSEIQPGLDAPWVKKLVESIGTVHRDVVLDTPELIEHFFTPLVARDYPSLGDIDISLFLLCREIKKRHTVAVSGESADEIFGGYPWFFSEAAIETDDFPWGNGPWTLGGYLRPEVAARLQLSDYARARYREAIAEVPVLPGERGREKRMREILYLNQTRFLLMLLDRKDRMSMATGLEVRVPFCDHRIVEYVWNVPWSMKAYRGREKGLLRYALEGILPDDVLWRKKSAYPSSQHPSYAAAVRGMLEEMLADARAPILPLIDVDKLRDELAGAYSTEHLERFGLRSMTRVWAYLVQVNEWMRRYHVRLSTG